MSADEKEIYEMLKKAPEAFVSMCDISKRLGRGKLFEQDRNWARPILLRMELDEVLESNPFGEYRLRERSGSTTSFFKAVHQPDASLGETTLFSLDNLPPKEK